MADGKISLDVVTTEKRVFTQDVDEVIIPAAGGYLGVRPGHLPMLVGLGIGVLSWRVSGQEGSASVAQGYAEILPDRVSVLAETAEVGAEIDPERAAAAARRAKEMLFKGMSDADVDLDRAREALEKAEARMKAGKSRRA